MKIQGKLVIFSTENDERKNVRKLKNKKLQIVLNKYNEYPNFEIDEKYNLKEAAEKEIENIFNTSKFYIEQLYTYGNPNSDSSDYKIIITYLVIINKKNINTIPQNLNFFSINILNKENESYQEVILNSENKKIQYPIQTIVKKNRDSVLYTYKLMKNTEIDELVAIIIHTGIKRLRTRIENTNIAFCFLDKEFSISELQQVYEIILDRKLVSANFRKKIKPMIKRTDKIVKESAYRPSIQYTFNEEFLCNWV